MFLNWTRESPGQRVVAQGAAMALAASGNRPEAIFAYRNAVAVDPRSVSARVALAFYREAFEAALTANPNVAGAAAARARLALLKNGTS